MDLEQTLELEAANKMAVNIMFYAASKFLVPITKGNDQKYFYMIFCFQIVGSDRFVVFLKLFKPLKRRARGNPNYFILEDRQTIICDSKSETIDHLNDFLSLFPDHERLVHNPSLFPDNTPAGEAILMINDWEFTLFEYFNELIYTQRANV